MKKIVLIIILFVAVLSGANAKQALQPSETVKKEIAIFKKADLNLSDIQLYRITTVLMAEDQHLQRNKSAAEGNKAVMETRLKELKANKIKNLKGALTDQQAIKFDALKLADQFE